METAGLDSDGRAFKNAEEMWMEHVGDSASRTKWYCEGVAYWQGVEASVDGVLGGYGRVNDVDISSSEAFLESLLFLRFPSARRDRPLVALDCGSGIGRVTKNLLIRHFNEVDLLEPVPHFLEAARKTLSIVASDHHRAANFYYVPLQEFTPDKGRYDVIWVQWCIGHLTDEDFISFFKRAKVGLRPGGFFILKENTAKSGFVLDKEDRSVTRSDPYFKELFHQCGLHMFKSKDQKGFPQELFHVKMYALFPELPKKKLRAMLKEQSNKPGIIKKMKMQPGVPPFSVRGRGIAPTPKVPPLQRE